MNKIICKLFHLILFITSGNKATKIKLRLPKKKTQTQKPLNLTFQTTARRINFKIDIFPKTDIPF